MIALLLSVVLAQEPPSPCVLARSLLAGFGGQDEAIDDTVRLHLVGQPELSLVKEMVEEAKGSDFAYDSSDNSVTFRFKGKIGAVEAVCKKIADKAKKEKADYAAYVLSHVRMRFTLVAGAGAGADPEKLRKALGDYKAIKKILSATATSLEVLCDGSQLWPPDVAKVCELNGYAATCKTHELVEARLQGDAWDATMREFNAVRDVLMVRTDPAGRLVRILGTKGDVKDRDVKSAAEKAGMKLQSVRRQ